MINPKQNHESYFTKNTATMTGYVYAHLKNPTPIKLQKALYFLWAFYEAGYATLPDYPDHLYPAVFEAEKYGPLINVVYEWQRNHQLATLQTNLNSNIKIYPKTIQTELLSFIEYILKQVDNTFDMKLVLRSQKDSAWQQARQKYRNHEMNVDDIIYDYTQYLKADL